LQTDVAPEKSTTTTVATADLSDGAQAAQRFLRDFTFPPTVPRDLADRYRSLLNRIEELKRKKSSMESGAYYATLEKLLVEAARTHREIRRAGSR